MSISAIKQLLKTHNLTPTTDEIKTKISELGLSSNLDEDGITKVVDAFIGATLAITDSNAIDNNQKQFASKTLNKGFTSKLQQDIAAFEQPIADISERISSDEAMRIYQQHVASVPDKVIRKTAELISVHQGDTKRCADDGQQFATALFSDFYAQ